MRDVKLEEAAWGWDASPISTARLSAELWNQIKGEDWSLVSDTTFVSHWPLYLWDFTKHYQFIGWSGAYGIGYGAPAAVGAALANRRHGRLSINIQCDGDLNYAPGVLWTAAHHRIPLLTIMHNNRAYHQERMYITDMAARANRDVSRSNIGNELADPFIDYASLAKAYGVHGIGPIDNPNDLGPAIKRAIEIVKRGEPVARSIRSRSRDESSRQMIRSLRGARGFSRAIHHSCSRALLRRYRRTAQHRRSGRDAAPVGNRDTGKRLYEKNTCFFCHGTAGQGSVDGARLAVVARNLQSFTRYVRQPTGRMPAFTDKILSDQELADIFAYVRSLPRREAGQGHPAARSAEEVSQRPRQTGFRFSRNAETPSLKSSLV